MRIIVATEKHATRYLDASTDETWARSSWKLLTERWNQGYYTTPDAQFEWTLNQLGQPLSQEEIDKLPGEYKEQAESKRRKYYSLLKEKEQYTKWYNEVKRVVEEQDLTTLIPYGRRNHPVAWQILFQRADAEYEHVELIEVEGIDD